MRSVVSSEYTAEGSLLPRRLGGIGGRRGEVLQLFFDVFRAADLLKHAPGLVEIAAATQDYACRSLREEQNPDEEENGWDGGE
ncbi:hypothetical protein IEQ34_014666 [Dendrobium chrysotoxum]|uniref:Uncharacterized protein n=1 Tax=Dendrobium chrysotoxum TaxID=161865 RepID=A0AAV7GM37_DENCH|nr:hypothetical protein IEQ34_014666 [Dendrobium chrysotoxum]